MVVVTGALPNGGQRRLLDAVLVSIAGARHRPRCAGGSHDAVSPEALQGAGAPELLGCGPVILGAAEAGLLDEIVQDQSKEGGDFEAAATRITRYRESRSKWDLGIHCTRRPTRAPGSGDTIASMTHLLCRRRSQPARFRASIATWR